MSFLTNIKKDVEKVGFEAGKGLPPRYWFGTGNYTLNRIISGSFYKGISQGRVTALAGPSGAGKSFLTANIIANIQKTEPDTIIVVMDSENALDEEFVTKVGVDVNNKNYLYYEVTLISDLTKLISPFIKGYATEFGDDADAQKVVIFIDSLDMLMTDSEESNFKKGETKGDQGQRAKQLKGTLRTFVQAIKRYNISIVVTSQVYANQDIYNGEGLWKINDAIKFSLSQILLLTKLKLKEGTEVTGIRMKAEGYKTRFTKPFQTITIEVPYEKGMNAYSGFVDSCVDLGILKKAGSWYTMPTTGEKFQAKNVTKYVDILLPLAEEKTESFLDVAKLLEEESSEQGETTKKTTVKRKSKVTK